MTGLCHFARRRRRPCTRRGLLTAEIAAAVALLLLVLVSLTRVLTAASQAERRSSELGAGQQHAANLLRRLTLLPWDELTHARAEQLARQYAQETGAEVLSVRIVREERSTPEATRVEVMAPPAASSQSDSNVSYKLTGWQFRRTQAPAEELP